MRKVSTVITASVVLLLLGILAWNAEAMTPNGVATVRQATDYSLVEKVGFRKCPGGAHQVCTQHACACSPAPAHVKTLVCASGQKICYYSCWENDENEGVTLCKYCAKRCP
jgi:hypothetical protein